MKIGLEQWPWGKPPPQEISTGEPTPFATFIRGRNPTFKAHSSLAHAKGALSVSYGMRRVDGVLKYAFSDEGALYEWDAANNRWLLRVYVQKNSTKDNYLLWTNPRAFKTGITNVIEETLSLEDA